MSTRRKVASPTPSRSLRGKFLYENRNPGPATVSAGGFFHPHWRFLRFSFPRTNRSLGFPSILPMGSGDRGGGGAGCWRGRRWGWVAAALIAVLLATAVTSRTSPKITLFGITDKPCKCSESRKYTGMVEDCCCDYETVDSLNNEVLHPILQDLVASPFFRYFKVKLWCDCPFWPDDGMCHLRDCSVCECPESEFPEPFKKPFLGLSADDLICQEGKPQATVDRTLDRKVFRGWIEIDNPWTHDDETDNDEMTYVNLQLNPERYTGYAGPSARRIWQAIYTENCPKC